MSKNFHFFAVKSHGYENLTCTKRNYQKYIAKARVVQAWGWGCRGTWLLFLSHATKKFSFLHFIDMNREDHLRNVFWAYARLIAAYKVLGDVISFDTTCLTNTYDLSFTFFVGINHHGQIVLFGSGLLSKGDT